MLRLKISELLLRGKPHLDQGFSITGPVPGKYLAGREEVSKAEFLCINILDKANFTLVEHMCIYKTPRNITLLSE